jgi:DNA-binding CsgD family transcriptional regulator
MINANSVFLDGKSPSSGNRKKDVRETRTYQDVAEFEKQLSQNHPLFLQNISAACPKLKLQELYICAMLRSRLSSKEIGSILNIKFTTVDNYRSRVRRKLGLIRDQNLEQFLLKY